MKTVRFNAYRIMWVLVLFDLPTSTKRERKTASTFRKRLLKSGFKMFQFSIYIRHCPSRENANVHIQRIEKNLPKAGKVCVFTITDKQFERMKIFYGKNEVKTPVPSQQLSIF